MDNHAKSRDSAANQQNGPDVLQSEEYPGGLTEDAALALLHNAEISAEAIASLSREPVVAKSRKVILALVTHSRTPRHISLPLLRRMFTFDLVQVTKTPVVAADIERAAEDQILIRIEALPAGQKITLARRASGRIAAELLRDPHQRVISPALENPQLTEALVIQAIMKRSTPQTAFALISAHPKWSQRREVQIALLRSEKTPLDRAKRFACNFSEAFLRSILPQARKQALLKEARKEQA
jgi:hypothetical protein